MKIFYWGCTLFFGHSVFVLIQDRYQIIYESKKLNEPFYILLCAKLSEIYTNETEIKFDGINEEIYDHFNRSESVIKHNNESVQKKYNRWVLEPIRKKRYMIWENRLCFNEIAFQDLKSFQFYSGKILKDLEYFIFHQKTFYIAKRQEHISEYIVLVVENIAYPYSNCRYGYSRFICLNECYKQKNSVAKYLYLNNEVEKVIQLNYNPNNQTLIIDEEDCRKKCKNDDCKLIYISPFKNYPGKHSLVVARPMISPFDYWAQLIGLIVLFTNICIHQIYTQLINKINNRIKRSKILICWKVTLHAQGRWQPQSAIYTKKRHKYLLRKTCQRWQRWNLHRISPHRRISPYRHPKCTRALFINNVFIFYYRQRCLVW